MTWKVFGRETQLSAVHRHRRQYARPRSTSHYSEVAPACTVESVAVEVPSVEVRVQMRVQMQAQTPREALASSTDGHSQKVWGFASDLIDTSGVQIHRTEHCLSLRDSVLGLYNGSSKINQRSIKSSQRTYQDLIRWLLVGAMLAFCASPGVPQRRGLQLGTSRHSRSQSRHRRRGWDQRREQTTGARNALWRSLFWSRSRVDSNHSGAEADQIQTLRWVWTGYVFVSF